jgi:hypothetical protein
MDLDPTRLLGSTDTASTLGSMANEAPVPRPVGDMPEVRALCENLVPGQIPLRISVDPPPRANPNDCMENVASVIEIHGGSVDYGWQLWETLPGVLLEAEFHAVWLDAEGRRLDVTPKQIPGLTSIVFLPDATLVYEGRQIDNVRVPLKDDPLVTAFINTAEDFFEATNRGELADYHGPVVLTPAMRAIAARRESLELQILKKYFT